MRHNNAYSIIKNTKYFSYHLKLLYYTLTVNYYFTIRKDTLLYGHFTI